MTPLRLLDTLDATRLDQKPPKFSLDLFSYRSDSGNQPQLENYNALCTSFRLFIFSIAGYMMLSSLEELSITLVAAVNPFARVLIPPGGVYA